MLPIVAVASIRGTCTHMQIISDDGPQVNIRAVYVLQVFSMADSKTERLHILLSV